MLVRLFRERRSLLLENLALRQQLVALKRRHPRPSLEPFDKLFWVIARRVWSAWKQSLVIVTPETIVRWHRTGFRMYMYAPRVLGFVPSRVFMMYRGDNRNQVCATKKRPVFGRGSSFGERQGTDGTPGENKLKLGGSELNGQMERPK
jgi:hypothetical protein